ncbi:MAG: cardiolipin synthase, partial [Gammaproteobacteria bacterium]|nr:cardiolipin synthase [Gemmatimonadota bacterium]NIU74806.1 cardiolipin synthase [Gammaproteobacteria bacterium]
MGALAYVMFGEARLGIRRSLHYQHMEEALGRSPELLDQFRDVAQPTLGEPYRTLARLSANTGASEPLAGNELRLFPDTGELFRSVVDDIDAAERHCHLLFYIAHDDEVGHMVGEALIRARQRGVICRVLLDAAGSRRFFRTALCRRLRDADVEVVPLMPVSFLRASAPRIDLRNHRKLVVVDGRIGYTGSHNLSTPTY